MAYCVCIYVCMHVRMYVCLLPCSLYMTLYVDKILNLFQFICGLDLSCFSASFSMYFISGLLLYLSFISIRTSSSSSGNSNSNNKKWKKSLLQVVANAKREDILRIKSS